MRPRSSIFLRARPRATAGRNRCRPRPAVGLDDVAVDDDLPFADGPEVGHGPQGAADETLDLLRPSGDAAGGPLALRPFCGGAGEHGVLGGDPAPPRPPEEGRDPLFDRGRGQDARPPDFDQGRAVGEVDVVDADLVRPELGRPALVRAERFHYLIQMPGTFALFVLAEKSSRSFFALLASASALRSLS